MHQQRSHHEETSGTGTLPYMHLLVNHILAVGAPPQRTRRRQLRERLAGRQDKGYVDAPPQHTRWRLRERLAGRRDKGYVDAPLQHTRWRLWERLAGRQDKEGGLHCGC